MNQPPKPPNQPNPFTPPNHTKPHNPTTIPTLAILAALAIITLLAISANTQKNNTMPNQPNPTQTNQTQTQTNQTQHQLATLGGGCFWCTEALIETLPGVHNVTSGYAGGHKPNPTYQEVCAETTGHAEVIQITYDPKTITYQTLLQHFWQAHDPTTLNRQGNDIGTQYRSIILYHNQQQKQTAQQSKKQIAQQLKKPITTQIQPLKKFYPAEPHHQNYYQKNPNQPYCAIIIQPKLKKFQKNQPTKPQTNQPKNNQTTN